jgi:hypothetical protein
MELYYSSAKFINDSLELNNYITAQMSWLNKKINNYITARNIYKMV